MIQGGINRFNWRASNSTAPSTTPGTVMTPGNNAFGSWVTLIASGSVTNDVYMVCVNIIAGNTSAAARDILVNIGIDEAGGTSFTTIIPNLLGSCAMTFNTAFGIMYYFPLFIKSGSTIGAQASVNNATVGTVRAWIKVFGLPSHPHNIKTGSFVRAIGANTAASNGTAVTPGASSAEGSWTSIGTTADDLWFWQVGMGINDTTMTATSVWADLSYGDATNKEIIIQDEVFLTTAVEQIAKSIFDMNYYCPVPNGGTIYGRLSSGSTLDSNFSMIAYGVGG